MSAPFDYGRRSRDYAIHRHGPSPEVYHRLAPWIDFEVLTPPPIEMRTGTLIDYRLRVRGLRLRWRSRISAWDPHRLG